MSKELVIGANRHETKVAILEDDQLVEVYFQRANEYSLAGSIHKGRVTRVLPGMQSAFVDLGLERDTFLYVSDFFEEHDDIDTVSEEKPGRGERRDRGQRDGDRGGREQDRGQRSERPAEERATNRETQQPRSEEQAGEQRAVAEGESGLATAEVQGNNEDAQHNQGERAEEGRNFRGDRRGRRSRRRRRGRGFPEHKYAQPGGGQATAHDESVGTAVEEEEENPADVVILPGESLAKYRHAAEVLEGSAPQHETDSSPEAPFRSEQQRAASEAGTDEHEVASEENLEAEAEEIELTDKVFGRAESVAEEEQKIAEVKQDQPVAPSNGSISLSVTGEAVTSDQEEPEINLTGSLDAAEAAEDETAQTTRLASFPAIDAGVIVEAASAEAPEGEPLQADEFDGADLEDTVEAYDVLSENSEPVQEETAPAQQTATVRDQGSRYLHRTSRRMRRRRGGNRFGQHNHGDGGNAEATGAGAGTAAAMQPEFRAEARRESQEEQTDKPERTLPSISDLLKPGQEIIVQIAKEPLGQKGARITSHVALPGRYVVFMPSVNHLGVSRKVSSEEERQRLKRILQTHRVGTTGGFIVRTAGEGVPEEEIAADMNFLYSLWLDIRQKAEKKPAPALLHYDLDIVQRILRDQITEDFKAIWVDNEEMYENVLSFMQRFQPSLVNRVKMYTRSAPIFDAFNITQELEKALRPKVWLKSGGYIVINQTEALVAIDINTGKYVGKSNRLEDTIVKTNTEAVKEIVRQIRLRDLGGIIVVDFIDMDERKNRQKVMQALEEAMRADRAPYKILQFNDFGLVAITRKRVKQSLERTLCAPCPYCEGAGYVKSVQTVIGEILVEAQKIAKAVEGENVVLRVHPDVAKVLKASNNRYLEEIEEILGRPVLVSGDPTLHHEKFDLA